LRSGEAGGVGGGGGGGGNTRRLQKYSKGPDLTLEDGCLQDRPGIRFNRCCMIPSNHEGSFSGHYGSSWEVPDIVCIECHLKGFKSGTAFWYLRNYLIFTSGAGAAIHSSFPQKLESLRLFGIFITSLERAYLDEGRSRFLGEEVSLEFKLILAFSKLSSLLTYSANALPPGRAFPALRRTCR
jgi:hypothetical protein